MMDCNAMERIQGIDHLNNISLSETGYIYCKIENNQLLPGEYTLDLALHTEDGFAYDYWRFATKFRMYSDTQDIGTTRLSHVWEIQ